MGRAEQITKAIRSHDRLLYCERNEEGKLCVYRKSNRVEAYSLRDENGEEAVLYNVRPAPHFIFALTDNWKADGRPVDWGIVPIQMRLKAIDLWHRDMASEIIENEERLLKSIERERQNTTESFLIDFRRQFAKTFDGVNTANMAKKDRRKIMERSKEAL